MGSRVTSGRPRAAAWCLRRDAGVRSFEELAAAVRVSPRTLRRRLADARVSFSTLLDEARRDRALALLRSPDAVHQGRGRTGRLLERRELHASVPAVDGTDTGRLPPGARASRLTRPRSQVADATKVANLLTTLRSELAEGGDAVPRRSELRRRDVHGVDLRLRLTRASAAAAIASSSSLVRSPTSVKNAPTPCRMPLVSSSARFVCSASQFVGRTAHRALREIRSTDRPSGRTGAGLRPRCSTLPPTRREVRNREQEQPRPQQRVLRLALAPLDTGRAAAAAAPSAPARARSSPGRTTRSSTTLPPAPRRAPMNTRIPYAASSRTSIRPTPSLA